VSKVLQLIRVLFGVYLGSIGLVVVAVLLFWTLGVLGVPLFLIFLGLYGWMITAYFHYRFGRQDEFLHLLTAAADAEAPLAPALRAYLRDRPHGSEREFFVGLLLFFVVPGYYWFWHRGHSFDRKVARAALALEQGAPLSEALRRAPGIASHETELAALVGGSTGKLAFTLRRAARGRIAHVWLEAMPRLLYPLLLIIFLATVIDFCMVFILPRFQKIFADFHMVLPWSTRQFANVVEFVSEHWWEVALGVQALVFLAVLWYVSATVRWFCPGLGWIYRLSIRSRVLQMLGILLEAGKNVPEALSILISSGYFTGVVRSRLKKARTLVESGEPLADSLRYVGLLPAPMMLLLRAAERARNLPWALAELGEQLAQRTIRLVQRMSLAAAPIAVLCIGILVGCVVVSMFLPMVKLIGELPS
jgi:type II secretory pathway component PulF